MQSSVIDAVPVRRPLRSDPTSIRETVDPRAAGAGESEPRQSSRVPPDEVRLSDKARAAIARLKGRPDIAEAIERPRPEPADPLAAAARKAHHFLKEHPRAAHSPMGQAVGHLIRGAAYLLHAEGTDGADPEALGKIQALAGRIDGFLGDHPALRETRFGAMVLPLIEEIPAYGETPAIGPPATQAAGDSVTLQDAA